jgi:uncharacterized protein YjbI with pentapeptide repeats
MLAGKDWKDFQSCLYLILHTWGAIQMSSNKEVVDEPYSTLRYATLRYATLRYATLLYSTLRYAALCVAPLRSSTLL